MNIKRSLSESLLLICSLCSALAYSTPSFMWVGTFAVDDYVGNGCGGSNLNSSIDAVNYFWENSILGEYLGSSRLRSYDDTNKLCTRNNLLNSSYCDFFVYAGHGTTAGHNMLIGCGPDYGTVYLRDMRQGTNYTRWAMYSSCHTLDNYNWLADVTPDFLGLQVLMGYSGVAYSEMDWYVFGDFWKNWTGKNIDGTNRSSIWGVWASFQKAACYWYYDYFHYSVAPACVEAYVPGKTGPCYNTYTQATNASYYPYSFLKYHWVYLPAPTY